MKTKDLIEVLQKYHKPDEELICTWWSKDEFQPELSDEQWQLVCQRADHKLDTSGMTGDIQYFISWALEVESE